MDRLCLIPILNSCSNFSCPHRPLLSSFVSGVHQKALHRLVGTVLNGYLCLRKLVVQRTKLVDETQDMLLEMLGGHDTTGSPAGGPPGCIRLRSAGSAWPSPGLLGPGPWAADASSHLSKGDIFLRLLVLRVGENSRSGLSKFGLVLKNFFAYLLLLCWFFVSAHRLQ